MTMRGAESQRRGRVEGHENSKCAYKHIWLIAITYSHIQ